MCRRADSGRLMVHSREELLPARAVDTPDSAQTSTPDHQRSDKNISLCFRLYYMIKDVIM
jgi:hypothetical protein